MGLMDKIKNLFTDEEIVEVTKDIEQPKEEEHKLPTFMREKIEKQEQVQIQKTFTPKKEEAPLPRENVLPEREISNFF